GNLVDEARFPKENALAPAPDCTETQGNPKAVSRYTICWQFTDGLA
ncbi:MAG: hypothetical protein QOJ40_2849, partial [Verrucomicrobiota bacterium]